jgi:rhodanese-related sulfurtransferase
MSFEITEACHLLKLSEQGALLLDVRSPAEYRSVHVQGAINLPLENVTASRVKELIQSNHKNPVVVLLCASGTRARTAADRLESSDLKLTVITGGTNSCIQLGIPVNRTKTKMISIERQVRIGAGFLVLTGVALGYWVAPAFYLLSGFIGAGLMFAGITDWCGMGMLLARAPWNK